MNYFKPSYFYVRITIITMFGGMMIILSIIFFLLPSFQDIRITDTTLQAMQQSAFHAASIAVPITSKSPLGIGYLEYSERGDYFLPNQSRIDKSDITPIIAALKPITWIEESYYLKPEEVDCILYCWTSKHARFYIKVTESQLIIWHKGHLYRGGCSKNFIALLDTIWMQHSDANLVEIKTDENGSIHMRACPIAPRIRRAGGCPCPEDLTDAETAEMEPENGRY